MNLGEGFLASPERKELFDRHARTYDADLDRGLALSGEKKSYFARGRIAWLAGCLRRLSYRPRVLMEFGCGNGSSTPLFFDLLDVKAVVGLDTSTELLRIARQSYGSDHVRFAAPSEYQVVEGADLVFCNGVFHHISPPERVSVMRWIHRALAPHGIFAFWENNPWNPGTRYVMSRIPFDRGAIKISPLEARRLLRKAGFEILGTDFLFFFPGAFRALRKLEPLLSRMPLGGQYLVLCRKPSGRGATR